MRVVAAAFGGWGALSDIGTLSDTPDPIGVGVGGRVGDGGRIPTVPHTDLPTNSLPNTACDTDPNHAPHTDVTAGTHNVDTPVSPDTHMF